MYVILIMYVQMNCRNDWFYYSKGTPASQERKGENHGWNIPV